MILCDILRTVGPALYTSPTINYTADGNWDAVTINIPGSGVAVTPGNAYVIDLTATGGTGNAVFGNTWQYLFGGLGAPTQGGGNCGSNKHRAAGSRQVQVSFVKCFRVPQNVHPPNGGDDQ